MNAQIEDISTNEQQIAATLSKRKMPVIVRGILCVLLAIILIADVAVITITTAVRMNATEEKIRELVADTDYMTIPLMIDNIQSNIYEMFFFVFANNSTGNVDIYKLAEDTDFEGFIAEQIYNYVAFILYDERLEGIDSDIIIEFYDKNADKINSAFNTSHNRNEICELIEGQEALFDKLTNNEIEASFPMVKLIRFVMSPVTFVIFSILAVVCIVFIGILSRSVGTPLVVTGIAATVVGLTISIISCLAIWGTIGVSLSPISAAGVIWQGVAGTVIPDVFTMFVYIFTVGILLILTGGFMGQIRRNLRYAKAAEK